MSSQKEMTLELRPESRLDVINVTERIRQQFGDRLWQYPKALYCSYHTTAGYFDQSLCERLNYSADSLQAFVQSFQKLFPPNANYQHDQLHLRRELSEEQRCSEPCNADSHLTFIGSGLANCVTYRNSPKTPVYFVDLDGICGDTSRRQTTVIGFTEERLVGTAQLTVPVSSHSVDSVNLKDGGLGLFDRLHALLERHEIVNGRIDISLAPEERHAGLTVNEYETLLMRHDLAEVVRNPFRFMAQKGKHMLLDPRAIPAKAKNYAKYDLVHVVNEFLDTPGPERVASAASSQQVAGRTGCALSGDEAIDESASLRPEWGGQRVDRPREIPKPDPGPVEEGRSSNASIGGFCCAL